jgi:putative ABC transport system permease protein
VTAEIYIGAAGTTFGLSLSPILSLPVSRIDELKQMEGVRDAIPVGQALRGRLIDGIDYDSFSRASGIRVVEGRPIISGDEAMIDRIAQRSRNLKIGDSIEVLDRPFHVVGIYEPESLGRIKIPLKTMQDSLNRENLATIIFVSVVDKSKQEEVAARIKERYPDHTVILTRDLTSLYARGIPSLQTFLRVVIGLSIVVSSLVILLAMYTTVTERTRQIGVLKSLGASKGWIAGEIEKEALVLSLLGVMVGFALSVIGKFIVQRLTGISVELEAIWIFYALVLGLLSGAVGALYPALRAANQDPVVALSYE